MWCEGNKWRTMLDCNGWSSDYCREHLSKGDIGVEGQEAILI